MSWRITSLVGAVIIGVAAASAGFAADPPATNPAPQGQGMMGDQQGQGMMGMMNMMTQMSRMADACTHMMDTANNMMQPPNNNPPAPATPPAQKPG